MVTIILGSEIDYLKAATERMEARRMGADRIYTNPYQFSARTAGIGQGLLYHYAQQARARRNDRMVAHYLLIECKEAGE